MAVGKALLEGVELPREYEYEAWRWRLSMP